MAEITVTMSIDEYERLKSIEKGFKEHIEMFQRACVVTEDGEKFTAVMTEELKTTIEEIYL